MKRTKGFTLIEILIVIVIIGILAAALIPSIGRTREKARDSVRLIGIKQLGSAIQSYGLNNGGFPIYYGCISSLTGLIEQGYISSIDKDPNNEIIHSQKICNDPTYICNEGSYNYISNGKRFIIAGYMENEENGNYRCTQCGGDDHSCTELGTLVGDKDIQNFLSGGKLNNNQNSHIYIYKYGKISN